MLRGSIRTSRPQLALTIGATNAPASQIGGSKSGVHPTGTRALQLARDDVGM
jgi:hypothetical protein